MTGIDHAPSPEQRLFRGVIVNAAMEAVGSTSVPDRSGDRERARRAAMAWFDAANDDFQMVCSLAGLDPQFVRSKVLAFVDRAAVDPSITSRRGKMRVH